MEAKFSQPDPCDDAGAVSGSEAKVDDTKSGGYPGGSVLADPG